MSKKRGIASEMLGWWILAIAVLAIMIVGYMILQGKGIGAIDFIKNMFRFGR